MKYLCVSPTGDLEIWTAGINNHEFIWQIMFNEYGSYHYCTWPSEISFWGREILEQFEE